jgi:hypothetical protein
MKPWLAGTLATGLVLVACHSHHPQRKPDPDDGEPGAFQERQPADAGRCWTRYDALSDREPGVPWASRTEMGRAGT